MLSTARQQLGLLLLLLQNAKLPRNYLLRKLFDWGPRVACIAIQVYLESVWLHEDQTQRWQLLHEH